MQMGYLVAGAVLVLILVIGISLLMVNAKRHGREGKRAAADSDSDYGRGVPGSDMAIIAEDPDAPLGDTTEHAGEQEEGTTVADQDADRSGGSGTPADGSDTATAGIGEEERPIDGAHVARPTVGGEGEGRRRI